MGNCTNSVDDVLVEALKPVMTTGTPAPGKFVKQVAPEYVGTGVYHALYLPTNWVAGNQYPVIVEYPCNQWESFTGKVEDANLGYYLTTGQDYIWVVMPVIQDSANLDFGFGEEDTTANYLKTNLRRILDTYGGDPSQVFITGFSRGAIGCNYYGTYDDSVADIWLGFLPDAHMDVGSLVSDPASAKVRVARTNGRSTFIVYGSLDSSSASDAQTGEHWLTGFGDPFIDCEIPNLGHTDTWVEYDNPARQQARQWLNDIRTHLPGVHNVSGRVTNDQGTGLSGALVETGPTHFTRTDGDGYYTIKNLVDGLHTISVMQSGYTFPSQNVTLAGANIGNVDFTGQLCDLFDDFEDGNATGGHVMDWG
ncbi:hypothetical protein CEB3_c04730 [Peptococcaceae bacterium CEB3]|nr:hypothetical protein CEB3_c04730 [Peptococcaceae bacterium CEB3]